MKRTQIGWLIVVIILLVDCLMLFQSRDIGAIKIALIISLIVLILFFRLTIVVDNEFVRFSFGIGLIRGKYKLSAIEYCRPINYFPFGFGIRFRPGVTLFNVSGTKAIELSMKGKSRKIWIGTNDPENVAATINDLINRKNEPKDYTVFKQSNSTKNNQYYLVVGVIAIIALFTLYGNQDVKITLQQNDFKISGLYGVKIRYNDILQIDTLTQMPKIKMRTNGYSFGKVCKGNFKLDEVGNAKLFINFKQHPFIHLKLKSNTTLYINFKNRQKTIELFGYIQNKMINSN
jgi:hypothetical protein